MNFPQETLDKATYVASEIKKRNNSQLDRALAIYNNHFIRLSYGISDAIKTGLGGIYLHEAHTEVDCFSRAGIDYIVADKLGLDPKIYIVRDMQDLEYGESMDGKQVYDHAFITVKANGKRIIVDKHMGKFGEVKFLEGGRIEIKKPDEGITVEITRFYNEKEELSREEYIRRMEEVRKPEGARIALGNAQTVINRKKKIYLEYFDEERRLVSSILFCGLDPIIETFPGNVERVMLDAPITEEGNWLVEEGLVRLIFAKRNGWRIDQIEGIHRDITLPYPDVQQYISHLEMGAKNFGRKTSLERLVTSYAEGYFEKIGFGEDGTLLHDNGVDQDEHLDLLERIWSCFPDSEPDFAQDFINQYGAYQARRFKNKSPENPVGFLYSKEQREELVNLFLEQLREKYDLHIDAIFDHKLAKAKIIPNKKEKERKLVSLRNNVGQVERFHHYLSKRGDGQIWFDSAIDFALFQQEHPLGEIQATDEEIQQMYKMNIHTTLINMVKVLPTLEVKTFQPGLRKILAI